MSLEDDVFRRFTPDYKKLVNFGFLEKDDKYLFEKHFMNNEFRALISVSKQGHVSGIVYDTENDEEYLPLRLKYQEGAFVGEIREAYEKFLIEIRNNCFTKNYFITEQANRIAEKIIGKYNDKPVFMWEKFPTYGVFRNGKNDKWYGIIMYIEKAKLDEPADGKVEIINLKLDKNKIPDLCKEEGIFPAWHMNKKYWVSVVLDDTLSDDKIMEFVSESYLYTV